MTTDERLQYEFQGFLHLPGVIDPATTNRVRLAFDRAAARRVPDGHTGFYDLPDILDEDDCFVDLVDLPAMMPILRMAVGDDIQLNHTHARIFPPGRTHTAPWHSDLAEVLGIDLGHSLNFFVKVHYFFEDLSPDQGCLAFIPGSHRLPREAPRPVIDDLESSKAAVKVVPKAGDAVLFNTHVLHMALDNTSPKVRKSLIYAYSHFWVKNYANAVPRDLERLATTRLRRQLFGVEEEGVSYFDQRADVNASSHPGTTLQSASKRLIRRLRRATSITRAR